jgi:hypothetical protein
MFLTALNSCAKPPFDGKSAMQYLETQCSFGPRNPNSEGHQKCLEFLTEELKKFCDRVDHQKFVYTDKKDTTLKLYGTNIIASINLQPKEKKRVLLCAHWDTRPWADKDPDSSNHYKPILGANDGASGVAVLLEIAKTIKQNPLDIGVDIILWDLEDYGEHNAELYPDSLNPYCIGSEYFAKNNKNYWPAYGILVDMIGDKNLDIPIERNSYNRAKEIVNKVWDKAKKLEKAAFRTSIETDIFDDHIPLLGIGIPCINIIDFSYPDAANRFHHTLADTPDKCSAESLQQVGDVLIEVLYSE